MAVSAAEALRQCEERLQAQAPKGIRIGVAVDGSQMSEKAAHIAASLVVPKRGDKYAVFHISDSSKTYLPAHLKPQHLKHYYEDMAAADKLGLKTEWVCREKLDGDSTCKSLVSLTDSHNVDLLVMGTYGRKGEKLDILGSVSDYTLRMSRASLCIVRSTGAKMGKQSKILFAADGSHASNLAFSFLTHFLRRPLDIVTVVFVSMTDGTVEAEWVREYRTYMAAHQIPGTVELKCIDRNVQTTIPGTILDAVKDTDSDVLVVGISGYSQKKLGSVSEFLCQHAHCTTIVIKDSLNVLGTPIVKDVLRFEEDRPRTPGGAVTPPPSTPPLPSE